MQPSPDPLSLLRQYNIDDKEIIERDGQFIFGEYAYQKDVKTNYFIHSKRPRIKEYYSLECLIFFLKNLNVVHPLYCQLADRMKMPRVQRPDRKNLLAYLCGETDTSTSIDKDAPLGKPTQVTVKRTHSNNGEESEDMKKKVKTEPEDGLDSPKDTTITALTEDIQKKEVKTEPEDGLDSPKDTTVTALTEDIQKKEVKTEPEDGLDSPKDTTITALTEDIQKKEVKTEPEDGLDSPKDTTVTALTEDIQKEEVKKELEVDE